MLWFVSSIWYQEMHVIWRVVDVCPFSGERSWLWRLLWCQLCIVIQCDQGAPNSDGIALAFAHRRKERTNPDTAVALARARVRGETALMKRRVEQVWRFQWSI